MRTGYLFDGAHGRQGDVLAPGTRHNLHADGQARAAKLHFTRRLLYQITGGGALNLFTGTHAGERHDTGRIAEQVVKNGVPAGGQDIAARAMRQGGQSAAGAEDHIEWRAGR